MSCNQEFVYILDVMQHAHRIAKSWAYGLLLGGGITYKLYILKQLRFYLNVIGKVG